MLKNSFGPCAFDSGPNIPVTMIYASGNFSPSIPINGIDPPSPQKTLSLPYTNLLAFESTLLIQGLNGGATHPLAPLAKVAVTLAPYGGSFSKTYLIASPATFASI